MNNENVGKLLQDFEDIGRIINYRDTERISNSI